MNVKQNYPVRHWLSVNDYHRMAEAGILVPDARVELVYGEIIDMAPIGSRHASVVNILDEKLKLALAERAIVQVQGPICLDQYSEPQPDLVVLRRRTDFYRNQLPSPDDVLLVVEVADTTIEYDRTVKLPLYAAHGIAEVWLVDLQNRKLEIYRVLRQGQYSVTEIVTQWDRAMPAAFPDIAIELDAILS